MHLRCCYRLQATELNEIDEKTHELFGCGGFEDAERTRRKCRAGALGTFESLLAALHLGRAQAIDTMKHFGVGYGKVFSGVTVHSPQSLAELQSVWDRARSDESRFFNPSTRVSAVPPASWRSVFRGHRTCGASEPAGA